MKFYFAAIAMMFSFGSHAIEPIRIEVSKNYESLSNEELRRRLHQMEKAVAQLQEQVFQLAMRDPSGSNDNTRGNWTCSMQSFGKTHMASGGKAAATALVLKKCSDATNAVHCHESDVNCDRD